MAKNLLIKNATVYDGSGTEPSSRDVLVHGRLISAIGDDISDPGGSVVDARGLALAPGFIDMHSHADFSFPSFPGAINSVSQGVTSEVIGNCGWSPAPLAYPADPHRSEWQHTSSPLGPDLPWDWTSFDEFLTVLENAKPAVNCIPLVGHSALRTAVLGIEDREATTSEIDQMRALLRDSLAAGAWGLSTGLVYPPSSFAAVAEIHALVEEVSALNGLYSTHMRDEGANLDAAIDEAVDVARQTGARVQISHLKAAGSANHGKIHAALEMIEEARSSRLQVGCDVYPYIAGSTVLTQLIPPWAIEGGSAALVERLRNPDVRKRISDQLESDPNTYLARTGGWDNVMIAAVENSALSQYQGRFLSEISRQEGREKAEVLFDVLVEDHARSTMILFIMDEDDVAAALDHPSAVIGSDQLGVTSDDARVHPRCYGTFATVIKRAAAVGDHALSDMVSRCSGRTARRLGLQDRGFVREGFVADLVLFDPSSVADRATFDLSTILATGIEQVFIGGEAVFDDGQPRNTSLGSVLRSSHEKDRQEWR